MWSRSDILVVRLVVRTHKTRQIMVGLAFSINGANANNTAILLFKVA
jgi:hypothetical protein